MADTPGDLKMAEFIGLQAIQNSRYEACSGVSFLIGVIVIPLSEIPANVLGFRSMLVTGIGGRPQVRQ